MPNVLTTPRGEALQGDPWQSYPRPQLRRDAWINLNGWWEFAVSPSEPETFDRRIRVPFCPESRLSGLETHFPEGACLWYRRRVTLPEDFRRGRVLLHVGAADQVADVYVGGKHLCHHEGGYEAFTVDITRQAQAETEIRIRCTDDLTDSAFPYGKQVQHRGGMWYTPVSGIWQTVWLESVPETYIEKLNIENRGASVTLSLVPPLSGTVAVDGLGQFPLENGSVTITPENPHFWSPEDPYLYEFTVETESDKVESYFAIRSLEIKQVGDYPRLCLNGKPYFFHGLLDQGYWPESLLTAPAPGSYADDILAMKCLGFNTLRKHIKIEPEEFYYQCDRLGMIVWQDMVNNGAYSYLRDTALPTLGLQKLDDRHLHRDARSRKAFRQNAEAAVNQLKNHPCICCWTIFNEGWGQFDSDNVCRWFRTLDDTRFIDTTSGWFRRRETDVDSRHQYFGKLKLRGDGVKPLVLSEFGGKTWRVEGHIFNPDKTYGYGACETREELNAAVEALYREAILPAVERGLCAAIYTQVSDVEDEVNGLLTYDRRVEKLSAETMRPIAQALQAALEKKKVASSEELG
ncbi:MAG: glycoside hydrolase family 2 TIM barrel-domain containing protein [Firmicutes bacterium]|nr:glycoside hydrolase family 2 TIM barrel-domain containing protein [Bacillota bacterium]